MDLLDRLRERFPNDNIKISHKNGKNMLTFNDRLIEVMWATDDRSKLNNVTFGKHMEDEIFEGLVGVIEDV